MAFEAAQCRVDPRCCAAVLFKLIPAKSMAKIMRRSFDITIFIPVLLGTIFGAAVMHLFTVDQRAHIAGGVVGTLVGVVVGVALQRKN